MNGYLQGGQTHTYIPSTEKQREKDHRVIANLGFIESSRPLTKGPFHLSVIIHLLDTNLYNLVIGEKDDADPQLLFIQCQVSLKEYVLSWSMRTTSS